jgi:hypothetical protein
MNWGSHGEESWNRNSKSVEPSGEVNSTFFDSPICCGSFVDINIF